MFRDSDHAANLFALAEIGNIYTRIMNPTQAVFEGRMAAFEGATETAVGIPGALAVSSGQAAETLAILNLAEAGSHIVSSAALYGGTYNLLHYTLPKIGIETTFIDDPDDLDAWRAAVRPNTKAFFGETIGNPRNDVLDLEGVSGVAHEVGVPLIVWTRRRRHPAHAAAKAAGTRRAGAPGPRVIRGGGVRKPHG